MAGAGIKVEIKGADSVLNRCAAIMAQSNSATHAAMETGLLEVERRAKINLTVNGSVVTGRLRASIGHYEPALLIDRTGEAKASDAIFDIKQQGAVTAGIIGTNVYYGKWLELGRSDYPCKPYLWPALESIRSQWVDMFRAAFKRDGIIQ